MSGPAPGAQLVVRDRFGTTNTFHGIYVGLAGEHTFDRWLVGWSGKLSMGYNDRSLAINGGTDLAIPGLATTRYNGGLLATGSNSDTYHSRTPVFVPEAGLNLGYRLTDSFTLRAGYSFLYWDRLWRPGEQIDLTVNPAYLQPGANLGATPVRPLARQQDSSLWVHGLNLGAELRF